MAIRYFRNNCLALLLWPVLLSAQKPETPYFQQEVHYTIEATLRDSQHLLTGHLTMAYINHSPDTLHHIWMHLWANAYQNRNTAFCRQKLRDGNTEFYFAKASDRGSFRQLDLQVDGKPVSLKNTPGNPDMALLTLPQPLLPGGRVVVSTPFELEIPASFSRLGHVETSYQMTQWYPKPAVYDRDGWHAMPYLDQGEFFSEFGTFDVTLTLPENYVVGATGTCQTSSEIAFLHEKYTQTQALMRQKNAPQEAPFPASSSRFKTIRYTAEKVHDFAWFADKRFLVLKDTAVLASGKTVDCWAMFEPKSMKLWEKGAFYVRRAVEFYSAKVGEYPYPHATAVHSALSAGGGMEYPMITVIGDASSRKDLDNVIAHEVGHNWFYGILASNERDHPFMDEGLNSYYETRYMKQFYGEYAPLELPKKLYDPGKSGSLLENGYLMLAREHNDTPPDSPSDKFSSIAYGLQVYMKTAMCLHWLENAVGTAQMDAAMMAYYQNWQFKHPAPGDFKAVLAEYNLKADWFFEAMQTQKHADYALKNIRRHQDGNWQLTIKQKGALSSPFPISALKDGVTVKTEWFNPLEAGFSTTRRTQVLSLQAPEADAFVIDRERITLEFNRKNNIRRTSGLFPGMEPWQVKMLSPFQNVYRNTIGVLPWLGWNNTDKTMLGVALYNPPLPTQPWQLFLLPGYALGSKKMVGTAQVRYHFFPGGVWHKVSLLLSAKTFHADLDALDQYRTRFYRIAPQIRANLRSHNPSFAHLLLYRALFIGQEVGQYLQDGTFVGKNWDRYLVHEWRYEGEQRALVRPFRYQLALEHQDAEYWRTTAQWRQQWYYAPKRKVTARFFAGYFLQHRRRNEAIAPPFRTLSLNPQGFNDYTFDQVFPDRLGGSGLLSRQVNQSEGGFKGVFGPQAAAVFGNSNNVLLALNVKTDVPKKWLPVPLKPYFDLGFVGNADPSLADQLVWASGLTLELLNGGLEVYFPLVQSSNLGVLYRNQSGGTGDPHTVFNGGNYLKNITWSFKINTADPIRVIQNFLQ